MLTLYFCCRFPPVFRSASRNRGTSAKSAKFAFRPAPGARTSRLEMKPFERKHVRQVDKSSPRLAARDGMEQGPYEFPTHALARAFGAKGLRRRTEKSATQPFLASKNLNQVTAAALVRCLAVCLRCKVQKISPTRMPCAHFQEIEVF